MQDLADEGGQFHCVFVCCDLPYQYIGDHFGKLGQDHFSPIVNDVGQVLPSSQTFSNEMVANDTWSWHRLHGLK